MISKRLATLLTFGVMLGQTGLLSTLFAQADSQLPTSAASVAQSIQDLKVASVIAHPDDTDTDSILKTPAQPQKPTTPDVYNIDLGSNQPPVTLQVKPLDDHNASLLINGDEVLRIRNQANAYDRVKTIAARLNGMMVLDSTTPANIKPVMNTQLLGGQEKPPVIRVGDDTLATVDAATAKAAGFPAKKLAFIWANRIREAFGENALTASDYPEMSAKSSLLSPLYKGTGRIQVGVASWYGPGFVGRRTASGARFDGHVLMAAHRTLPFGTIVHVINNRTHKSCYVRITDRGPYAHNRIIDLSRSAADAIGMSGVDKVSIEVVKPMIAASATN